MEGRRLSALPFSSDGRSHILVKLPFPAAAYRDELRCCRVPQLESARSGIRLPSAPHDRHKRAKADKCNSRSHFPLAVDLLIVMADIFPHP